MTGLIVDLIVGNTVRTIEALGYNLIQSSNKFCRVNFKPYTYFGNAFRISDFRDISGYDFDMYITAIYCGKSDYFDCLNDVCAINVNSDCISGQTEKSHAEACNQFFKIYEVVLKGFTSMYNELKIRCSDLRDTALKHVETITSEELEVAIRRVQSYNEHLEKLQDWRLQMLSRLNLIACKQFQLVRFRDTKTDSAWTVDVDDALFNAMQELISFTAKYILTGMQKLGTELYKLEATSYQHSADDVESNISNDTINPNTNKNISEGEDTHLF